MLTCLGMAVINGLLGFNTQMVVLLVLTASVGGFLFWNVPPAKIFMGDVGSGFLGFALAVFSLQSMQFQPALLWCWLILMGVFIVDATVTLMVRAWRGEKLDEAHRTHAYQHAAQCCHRHWPVTLVVIGLNVLWLFPLALLIGLNRLHGCLGLILAYVPLLILVWLFKAGQPHHQDS